LISRGAASPAELAINTPKNRAANTAPRAPKGMIEIDALIREFCSNEKRHILAFARRDWDAFITIY
jgi:hypothetical protein